MVFETSAIHISLRLFPTRTRHVLLDRHFLGCLMLQSASQMRQRRANLAVVGGLLLAIGTFARSNLLAKADLRD